LERLYYLLCLAMCERVSLRLTTLIMGRGVCARVAALSIYFVSRLLLSLSRLSAITCEQPTNDDDHSSHANGNLRETHGNHQVVSG